MATVQARQSTGIEGLDKVLGGGLLPSTCTLVCGAAGTGKTTLGLQFLCEGAGLGEGGVYISFEEFPEQLYRDAAEFGLDLPLLEQAGKLQVVTVAPEVFMQEATAPGGLLEELQAEVGMRRIVIDSLTLIEAAMQSQVDVRRSFYLLRNALHRLGVSSMLLEERQPGAANDPLSEFVADTVLYLTFDNLDGHRLRHVEVRKHRGSSFLPGQHIFVFAENGMRVLPALNRIPDLTVGEVVPTGLTLLDRSLGGGIPRGSAFALNVNSKCNYRYLVGSIVSAHLRQGDGYLNGRSALNPSAEVASVLSLYGYDAVQLGASGRWTAIEFMDRPAPKELAPYIIRVPDEAEAHQQAVEEIVMSRWRGEVGNARHWLWTVDLNTVMRKVGDEAVIREWSERVAHARHLGHTIIAICNFEEMGASLASFVQRTAAGILRTWFDGRYQYLQVQKAPNGRVSEPMVIEYTETPPYMVLW